MDRDPTYGPYTADLVLGEHLEPVGDFLRLTEEGRLAFVRNVRGLPRAPHPSMAAFLDQHPDVTLSCNIRSWKFQMVNLLVGHPRIAFVKADLQAFHDRIRPWMRRKASSDICQAVNKTEQYGLGNTRFDVRGVRYYAIPHPLRYVPSKLKLRTGALPPDQEQLEIARRVQEYQLNRWSQDVEHWDVSHLDPEDPSLVTMLPASVNRSDRDRYKIDRHGNRTVPTAAYLSQRLGHFYPRVKERAELALESLRSLPDVERAAVLAQLGIAPA